MASRIVESWISMLAKFGITEKPEVEAGRLEIGIQTYSLMAILARYSATDEQISEAVKSIAVDPDMFKLKLNSAGDIYRTKYRLSRVEVVKVPGGDAPPEYKEKWVGTSFPVIHVPKKQIRVASIQGSEPAPRRDAVVTLALPALMALESSSAEAANWFMDKFTGGSLSFGENEVKVTEHIR